MPNVTNSVRPQLRDAVREFVLNGVGITPSADGQTPDGPAAPAEHRLGQIPLGSRFSWQADGRPGTVRRTWLDTFDWRLYRAGLTLELSSGRGGGEYRLTGRDGGLLASQPASPRGSQPDWPGMLSALPDGPLREQLGPVVGVRALLPVARAVSSVSQLRVLNADDKTVARACVDRMSATFPAKAAIAPRLTLTELRGYQAQADRLAELLAAAPGITVGATGPLESALATAGRKPGDYSGKISVRLTPQMPAGRAVATVLSALMDTLEANVSGTVRDIDTEFLHDLRIAVRRTRSTLKLAGDVLPTGVAGRFQPEFKWLGDLTTPTRDLDVYLLGFDGMSAALVAATPEELLPFREHLARRRSAEQRQLARGLRSTRFSHLCTQWREALGSLPAGRQARPDVRPLADSRIRRAHRRVLRDGSAITAASAPAALHDLRKRCKELRYLLEIFGSLYDPGQHWQAVRELKALQDCLGEYQDTEVQQDEIRAFAAQMMADRTAPATTLLAMGEVAAGLARDQRRARSEFAGRFRDFASPAGQNRILALTGGTPS
jgi:CHAD domain-containing protein